MIQAIQTGIKRALTQWQLTVLLYAINLVFALGLALAFKNLLADEFALRDVSSRLVEGFDFAFLSDLNYASVSISSLLKIFNWFLVGYVLISVFLSGGIIATLRREEFSFPDFFADSARYVGRFIVLGLCFAPTLLLPILVVVAFSTIGGIQSDSAVSEVPVVIWTVAGIGIAAITLAFFHLVFEVAKFEVASESMKPFRAFVSAFKIVFKNFPVLFGIVVVFLALIGAIGGVLHLLAPKAETGVGIFVLVLMQQALVVSRLFLRVATVGGLMNQYQEYRAILNEKKRAEELDDVGHYEERSHKTETIPAESEQARTEQSMSEPSPSEHLPSDAHTVEIHQTNGNDAAQKPNELQS